jgi:hypothetical protein
MPSSPKKGCTRYGAIKEPEAKFGTEERFQWQKPKFSSDVVYNVSDPANTRNILFGSSLRNDTSENPAAKSSTGPGSYDPAGCYDHLSEYAMKKGNRFSASARESMAMKTPSPGPVYNIDKQFYTGAEKNEGIGFNCDSRKDSKPLPAGAGADMVLVKMPKSVAITIGKRFKQKTGAGTSPGNIYNAHEKMNFQTGPKFSFGNGKGDRFSKAGFLPELD